jgi:hypothetical protein
MGTATDLKTQGRGSVFGLWQLRALCQVLGLEACVSISRDLKMALKKLVGPQMHRFRSSWDTDFPDCLEGGRKM